MCALAAFYGRRVKPHRTADIGDGVWFGTVSDFIFVLTKKKTHGCFVIHFYLWKEGLMEG